MIKYSNKSGFYVGSTELCKHLGVSHQDLMRKVDRVDKVRYRPYNIIKDKYCKDGKRKSYRLSAIAISKLGLTDIREVMDTKRKEWKIEIEKRLDSMFGVK